MKRQPLKRKTALRHRSAKRAALYRRERVPLVRQLLAERPRCQVPWCTRRSVDVHEVLRRSRGGSISDVANLRCLCRECHDQITFRCPEWAYELGFALRKGER